MQLRGAFSRDATGAAEGARPVGVRDYNERLVLSLIRDSGPIGSAEIARATNLSAQTSSVITRSLESEGLVMRGAPVKGRVGKPTTPLVIAPDSVVSYGLRIGRRSADFLQIDLSGALRGHLTQVYPVPTPEVICDFVVRGMRELPAPDRESRIAGLGVASPYELWNWLELVGAEQSQMEAWRDFDFTRDLDLDPQKDIPVLVGNDISMAAFGELHFGLRPELRDFGYFYVGAFVGGGVVIDGRLVRGTNGNAGAFGSIPVSDPASPGHQLIEHASIHILERDIRKTGADPALLWTEPDNWSGIGPTLDCWLEQTAFGLATAIVAVTAVLDLPKMVIDGSFPPDIRSRLRDQVEAQMAHVDTRGVKTPEILEGSLGRMAGAYGAAHDPLLLRYLMD
jgi:predicted NBD/HSP70 family sugar kinase